MNINFEEMSGREKELYEKMWSDYDFGTMDAEIVRTYNTRYQKESKNSYCFGGGIDKGQVLVKAFNIENADLFLKKYEMATSGSGDEQQKITILRSSSLCALLHFYNITDDYPLILEFVTNKRKRKVKFTESMFEYKSPVLNNPSNMDIVLLGKEDDQDVILFLESKFSEHYIYASIIRSGISCQYLDENCPSASLYDDAVLKELGLKKEIENKDEFKLETNNKEQMYIEGIKQMISHYTGLMNVINGKLYEGEKPEDHKKIDTAIKNKEVAVILGEIVFDGRIDDLEKKEYSKKYHMLATHIAELTRGNDRFEMIIDELGYSLFKDSEHRVEPKIREFYRYDA